MRPQQYVPRRHQRRERRVALLTEIHGSICTRVRRFTRKNKTVMKIGVAAQSPGLHPQEANL
jgi:hypothetical protein